MLNFLWLALIVDLLSSFLVESRQLNWLHKFILLLTMAKKLQPLRRLMIASSKQPKLFGLCCYEMKHFILASRPAAWFRICLNFIRQHNLSLFQLQPPLAFPRPTPALSTNLDLTKFKEFCNTWNTRLGLPVFVARVQSVSVRAGFVV